MTNKSKCISFYFFILFIFVNIWLITQKQKLFTACHYNLILQSNSSFSLLFHKRRFASMCTQLNPTLLFLIILVEGWFSLHLTHFLSCAIFITFPYPITNSLFLKYPTQHPSQIISILTLSHAVFELGLWNSQSSFYNNTSTF